MFNDILTKNRVENRIKNRFEIKFSIRNLSDIRYQKLFSIRNFNDTRYQYNVSTQLENSIRNRKLNLTRLIYVYIIFKLFDFMFNTLNKIEKIIEIKQSMFPQKIVY